MFADEEIQFTSLQGIVDGLCGMGDGFLRAIIGPAIQGLERIALRQGGIGATLPSGVLLGKADDVLQLVNSFGISTLLKQFVRLTDAIQKLLL